jgi:hypothetical protein
MASSPVQEAFCRAAKVEVAWQAPRSALLPAAARAVAHLRRVEVRAAVRAEASVPDATAAWLRRAALAAPDAPAVPLQGAAEEVVASDAPWPVEEAGVVASVVTAVPRRAAQAVSDATEVLPQEAVAGPDAQEAAAAVGAAPHAAAAPREAAVLAVAAARRVAVEAVLAVAEVPRQAAVPGAAEAVPAALPSAVAWACRQGRLRPAAP